MTRTQMSCTTFLDILDVIVTDFLQQLKTGTAMSKFKLNTLCELDSLGCEL